MIGPHDHLNEDDPVALEVNMDDLAEEILQMNYGASRFAAALIRAIERENGKNRRHDNLKKALEQWIRSEYTY